ncbi:hypothetical protein [Streptomyces sp. NPDC059708]|uniref:hypothetical protein n=1 Tax=Streptomyces sp. NPDC059708 TaxID=3346916 RepID=UPI0036B4EFFD
MSDDDFFLELELLGLLDGDESAGGHGPRRIAPQQPGDKPALTFDPDTAVLRSADHPDLKVFLDAGQLAWMARLAKETAAQPETAAPAGPDGAPAPYTYKYDVTDAETQLHHGQERAAETGPVMARGLGVGVSRSTVLRPAAGDRGGLPGPAPFLAEGATAGAPQAVQVADRWHLRHNLSGAAERSVSRYHRCPRVPVPSASQAESDPPTDRRRPQQAPLGYRGGATGACAPTYP